MMMEATTSRSLVPVRVHSGDVLGLASTMTIEQDIVLEPEVFSNRDSDDTAQLPAVHQLDIPGLSSDQHTLVLAGGEVRRLERASITLSDCLACSGCVTSAETVLIEQQSEQLLVRTLQENRLAGGQLTPVVSLSPQAVVSFAAELGVSADQAAQHLSGLLRQLGVQFVFDIGVARALALRQLQSDFLSRLQRRDAGGDASVACLPLLSSSCPGFVCYAEKTHGSFLLPHVSRVKSPQQTAGALLKGVWCRSRGVQPNRVYHVSVMPCFDKKLEASRADAAVTASSGDDAAVREVDCVVTPIELARLLESEGRRLSDVPPAPLDSLLQDDAHVQTIAPPGSGSGGLALHVLRAAALLEGAVPPGPSAFSPAPPRRSQDLLEARLDRPGRPPLRFAIANGFRNIQNLVQKMKRGRCVYDFVEVMACPGGCVNGGAMLRPPPELDARQRLSDVRTLYDSVCQEPTALLEAAVDVVQQATDPQALIAEYHAVEANTSGLSIKW